MAFDQFVLFLRSLKVGEKVNIEADGGEFSKEGVPEKILSPAPEFNAILPADTKDWVETVFNPIFSAWAHLMLGFVGIRDGENFLSLAELGIRDLNDFSSVEREEDDRFYTLVFEVRESE